MTRAKKQYLVRGAEDRECLDILLNATGITSENFKSAFYDHFVRGLARTHSCLINDYDEGNFSRAMKVINKKAEEFEKYAEIKWKLSAK